MRKSLHALFWEIQEKLCSHLKSGFQFLTKKSSAIFSIPWFYQWVLGGSKCNAIGLVLILQQKYDFFRWKYKMSLVKKYWWKARAAAASWISSVAGRQSPGEEVGRVARFQRHTKLVVAQFRIFRGTAGAFPSTYWGSFEFFWCNGNGDLLLRSGPD